MRRADFPCYLQEIKALGVTGYETHVLDGHVVYHAENKFTTQLSNLAFFFSQSPIYFPSIL
ncbi:MAG: DUF1398 family protein [Chitinophagales bacterium]|nr:DUF1398 family protein [Chitinophagales bacterium]